MRRHPEGAKNIGIPGKSLRMREHLRRGRMPVEGAVIGLHPDIPAQRIGPGLGDITPKHRAGGRIVHWERQAGPHGEHGCRIREFKLKPVYGLRGWKFCEAVHIQHRTRQLNLIPGQCHTPLDIGFPRSFEGILQGVRPKESHHIPPLYPGQDTRCMLRKERGTALMMSRLIHQHPVTRQDGPFHGTGGHMIHLHHIVPEPLSQEYTANQPNHNQGNSMQRP